jgi:hypothetical protein
MMRIGLSRWAFALLLASLGAGCAYNDHVDNRVATYDVAAEKARDEMILTNIVRASRAEPLAFLQLGQITGLSSVSATVGLPSLVFGPAPTKLIGALQKQTAFGTDPGTTGFAPNATSISGTTTVNVTPAETKEFYLGLLTSVEPDTLAFFRQQGIAPELLFYLFTDKVVEQKGGVVHQFRNDPLDPNFDKFQNYVALAMQYGLSSEEEPGAKPASSPKTKSASGAGDDKSPPPKWRLCFEKSAWAPGVKPAGNEPICGSKQKSADPRSVTFLDRNGERVRAQVLPRSTFAIFQYLGHIVAAERSGRIKLASEEATGHEPLFDDQLFDIAIDGNAAGDCFLFVAYGSHNYCVPEHGARNTKRILGLLAQLIALSTSLSGIPVTQQVQLIQ